MTPDHPRTCTHVLLFYWQLSNPHKWNTMESCCWEGQPSCDNHLSQVLADILNTTRGPIMHAWEGMLWTPLTELLSVQMAGHCWKWRRAREVKEPCAAWLGVGGGVQGWVDVHTLICVSPAMRDIWWRAIRVGAPAGRGNRMMSPQRLAMEIADGLRENPKLQE